MFSLFKKDKKDSPSRVLDHPKQLLAGDLLSLKDRSTLPDELQGQTLTVKKVQAYQYSENTLTPEFVLELPNGQTFTMMLDDEDGEEFITLSKALSRQEVGELFDLDAFAELFEEGFAELETNQDAAAHHAGWVGDQYHQTIKSAIAYFYQTDQRNKSTSELAYEDDSSECLYHECEGTPDHYSLTVEVWEDGDTDVYIQASFSLTVIEEMWPNAE